MFLRFLMLVLAVAVCLPLNGCLAFLAGSAAGAGGYYAGKNDGDSPREQARRAREEREAKRQEQRRQVDQQKQDKDLTTQLSQRYLSGELTRVLTVNSTVQDGVVYLDGVVPSPKVAERAITIAQSTPGVKQVVSRLQIMPATVSQAGMAPMGAAAVPMMVAPQTAGGAPVMMAPQQGLPPTLGTGQHYDTTVNTMAPATAGFGATPYIPTQTVTPMNAVRAAPPNNEPAPVYAIPGALPAEGEEAPAQ